MHDPGCAWPFLLQLSWISLQIVSSIPAATAANRVNVAVGKHCNLSSAYENNCTGAINDDTIAEFSAGNCIHTADADSYPSWTVDLGEVHNIDEITVFARGGFEKRMTNVTVSVDDQLVYRFPSSASSVQLKTRICRSNSLQKPLSGRVVTLARYNKPDDDSSFVLLNFCELQVWVCPPGKSCLEQCAECGDGCLGGSCDLETGYCNCSHHWQPPLCQDCVADHYRSDQGCVLCAEGCVSGTCDQNEQGRCSCKQGYILPNCTEMCAEGQYGINCTERCGEGCQSTCDKVNGTCTCHSSEWQPPFCSDCVADHYRSDQGCVRCAEGCVPGTCDQNEQGRCRCKQGYVLSNCTKMCAEGQYGINCTERCGEGCQSTCDKVNGTCTCHSSEWRPPFCSDCAADHYRSDQGCVPCAEGCVPGTCDQNEQGRCRCKQGYVQSNCTEMCPDGQYGTSCNDRCGEGCRSTCDKVNGTCACRSHEWQPPKCTAKVGNVKNSHSVLRVENISRLLGIVTIFLSLL